MHRCSGSNMVEPCSCGLYHHQTNSFSMLFSMPYETDTCPYATSESFSSVDCTLSLGTPSTRLSTTTDHHEKPRPRPSGTNFCWDILQYAKHTAATATATPNKVNRGGGNSSDAVDPLRARRCANCDTTSTPLWRNGPRGPKSLCNACGIRFKKEERRATAAAAVTSGGAEGHHHHMMNGNQWVNHTQATHKLPSYYTPAAATTENEFRFIDDVDDRDSTFLSWRLNVTDRPALVHDFTR